MLTVFKLKLIEALRSGKYKQTKYRLKRNGCFCLLGVMCDLYDPTQWKDGGCGWDVYGPDEYLASLPPDLCKILQVGGPEHSKLIRMNDVRHLTFDQIADELEKTCPA